MWIGQCISLASFAVLVNVSLIEFSLACRGLLLFLSAVKVMEVFVGMLF